MIHGFMREKLDLSGNGLLAYALIYSFTRDGESVFYASVNTLSEVIGCSRVTAGKVLGELSARGFIECVGMSSHGVRYYRARLEILGEEDCSEPIEREERTKGETLASKAKINALNSAAKAAPKCDSANAEPDANAKENSEHEMGIDEVAVRKNAVKVAFATPKRANDRASENELIEGDFEVPITRKIAKELGLEPPFTMDDVKRRYEELYNTEWDFDLDNYFFAYGEKANVLLTMRQHDRLTKIAEYQAVERYIERLGEYIESKPGVRCFSHYKLIRKWMREDGEV